MTLLGRNSAEYVKEEVKLQGKLIWTRQCYPGDVIEYTLTFPEALLLTDTCNKANVV